jgi:hypothetical protein
MSQSNINNMDGAAGLRWFPVKKRAFLLFSPSPFQGRIFFAFVVAAAVFREGKAETFYQLDISQAFCNYADILLVVSIY